MASWPRLEMTEEQFWKLIEQSRHDFDPERRDGKMERQKTILRDLLSGLSTEDVRQFQQLLATVFDRAYRWELWAAADVIASGCSDVFSISSIS